MNSDPRIPNDWSRPDNSEWLAQIQEFKMINLDPEIQNEGSRFSGMRIQTFF